MTAILYLILGTFLGLCFIVPVSRKYIEADYRIWVVFPAAFAAGNLVLSWLTYTIAWIFSVYLGADKPLFPANIISMAAAALVIAGFIIKERSRIKNWGRLMTSHKEGRAFKRELILFGILAIFITVIMFFVLFVYDGRLYAGWTVFGDYAPHTAMMRSFSLGNNFPTQYPHFGGEDVKYHFMFQFLCGNLEYLGLRIDIAYNIPSILSLLGMLMLLYCLALRVFHKRRVGATAIVLFLFRSGFAMFRYVADHIKAGDLFTALAENTSFIGYTANENWGLWNFNVYLNQRHLAFVFTLVLFAVICLWGHMEDGRDQNMACWFKSCFLCKKAWSFNDIGLAIMLGILLGMCAFFNGAVLIGGLLILAGMAAFSKNKLDYALMAAIAVFLSVMQSRVFMTGDTLGISFLWGFIVEDKSLPGIIWYILQTFGIFFVCLPVFWAYLKKREGAFMAACLLPLVFAFTISMTPDVTVNHKYILISYIFLTLFWADALWRLWNGRIILKLLSAVMVFTLTFTGFYEMILVFRGNDSLHRVSVNMDSDLTAWLAENTTHEDLVLTPEYSINEVTLSGCMLYNGWPYYAWSAGYDTYGRADKAKTIYTSGDSMLIKDLVSGENITCIIYEEGMEYEGETACREDIIADLYSLAYVSEDGRIRIYDTATK